MAIDVVPDPLASADHTDPGDETFRRFRYQATFSATLAVGLLEDSSDVLEVYCEQYEDILLRLTNAKFRGFQVKTKADDGTAPRATDEAVITALLRFIELDLFFPDMFEGFTLASSTAFERSGKGHGNLPLVVAQACAYGADKTSPCDKARRLAKTLLTRLKKATPRLRRTKEPKRATPAAMTAPGPQPAPSPGSASSGPAAGRVPTEEDILRVFAKLDLRDDLPKLPDIRSRLRDRLVALSDRVSGSTYGTVERVVDDIERMAYLACSRGDEDANGRYWFVASPERRATLQVSDQIRAKCLCRTDIESAIEARCHAALLVSASPVIPGQPPTELTILDRKLIAGGLSVGTINFARDAVASTEEFGTQLLYVHDQAEGLRRYNHARAVAKKESTIAYESQVANGAVSGPHMLRDIELRLKDRRASDTTGVGLIRFGGHPTKGVEDGHHGRDGEQEATATAAYG